MQSHHACSRGRLAVAALTGGCMTHTFPAPGRARSTRATGTYLASLRVHLHTKWRRDPPSRCPRATLAPHPRPPLSLVARAFSTLFAPPRAPLAAPPRSPASAGQPPHPHDHHHGLGPHHRQPAGQNPVWRVTEDGSPRKWMQAVDLCRIS